MTNENSSDFKPLTQDPDEASYTIRKISGFKGLEDGWCYGEGESFKDNIIEEANRLNRMMYDLGFIRTNAFPCTNGGIMVTLYHGDDCLEFTIEPDETITFVHEAGTEELSGRVNLSLDDAKGILWNFKKQKHASLGLSIKATMTPNWKSLEVAHLAFQAGMEEYPLLVRSVS